MALNRLTESDETHYRVLRLLEAHPEMSQRDVAGALRMSLGKINQCVRVLVRKGWLSVVHFKNSRNRVGYLYRLTPLGLEEMSRLALHCLQAKVREIELLDIEIKQLIRESERAD